jgi:eukaryotic-like serine/threonine-protein kinase
MKLDLATEERALRKAVEKGLLKEADLREVDAEAMNLVPAAEDLSPRMELLLRKRLIKAAILQSLIQEAKEESVAEQQLSDATLQLTFPETLPVSIPSFGRYVNLELLGQGGMATVYKAFDPSLGRHVALKFLRRDDPNHLKRFLMEARLQARINHENICRVYEAGQVEDKPYIAMQYIEGKTLKDLASQLTTLEKADVMKHVAAAVHEAHRMGLIHRDLKPVNILVERAADGEWTPYVLDFGIARHAEGSDMTATGLILGTPWYMSPEQASGNSDLDHRTDIYSLGATMYELFSGRLPFEAPSGGEVLLKIMIQDPVPLQQRDPAIPMDLQTIVMKCMEKEPGRRYQSAKAVADELDRYIKGDPILARPTGIFSRTYKKVRKNRPVAITVAVGLLMIGILLTISIRARWKAQKQTEIAQNFGQQIARMESGLRSAYLQPLHDVRPDKKKVRTQMKEIEQQMRQLGESAEGPGYYALGRGHLALDEYSQAKNNFEKAIEKSFDTPDLAHALGLTLGALYKQQLQEAERIQNKEIKKSVTEKIQKEYRDPALQYLKKGDAPEYVSALIAFYEKRWKDSERLADLALQHDSSLYEAKTLKGNIHAAIANEFYNAGKLQPAIDEFERSAKNLEDAIEFARSDPGAHTDLCDLRLQVVNLHAYQESGDLNPPMDKLMEACNRALQLDPDQGQIHTKKAEAFWLKGRWMMENGNDPVPVLIEGRKEAEKAIALDGKDGSAYKTAGVAYLVQGEYELNAGRDSRKTLAAAVQNLKRAIELSPDPLAATNSLGNAFWLLGRYNADHGADPIPHFLSAIKNYNKAIRLEPKFSSVYINMGIVYGSIAAHKMSQGQDPIPDLNKSIESLEQSIRLNPGDSLTYNSLGNRWAELGDYQISTGKNPSEAYQKSIAAFDKAQQLNKGWFSPVLNRGVTYQSYGDYALSQGGDPTDFVRKAIKDYEQAIRLNPTYFGSYGSMALAYRTLGLFAIYLGKDPAEYHQPGLQLVEKALKSNPEDLDSLLIESVIHLDRAKYLLSRDESPLSSLDKTKVPLQKAEKLDPTIAEVHIYKAETHLIAARWKPDEQNFQHALDSVNKAIALNPKSADAQLIRAKIFLYSTQRHQDAKELGIAACNEVIKLNPELAEAYAVRGVLTKSKKDLEEAFRINKHLRAEYGGE